MTNSEPVKVAVEIIDKFSDDLTELETRLEKIDGKTLNVDLDIDASDIEEVEARLEKLEEDINSTLDIDVQGYTSAKAQKEELEDDMHSTLHVGVDKDRLRGLGNLNGGEGFNPPSGGGSMGSLVGLEGLDLADDVFDHTLENLRGFEGSSVEYADSVRRFTPEEQDVINDWIINPDVARAHNRGIPADERDGWIGPSNWDFGIGEKWGPEPRYPGDEKPIDAQTDFLRGIKKMTDSWSDIEGNGPDFDVEDIDVGINTNIGDPDSDRTAPEIDFLREINRATTRANKYTGSSREMLPDSPSIDMRSLNWDAPIGPTPFGDLPIKERGQFRFSQISDSVSRGLSSVTESAIEAVPDPESIGADDGLRGFTKRLKSLIPSMRVWYSLIAGILPLLITLAGAALGAAAALGALAMAGVALVGIGLLGYGDSLSESLNNAKRAASELKSELFDVFQPVGMTFQPFVEQLFDNIPSVADKLTDPLKGLEESGYDDFFLGALEGTGNWLAELIDLANELAPEIQAIGASLGVAFGSGIIDLLRWAVLELYNNWDAFARLAGIVVSLIVVIYNLSKALSFAFSVFAPLLGIVEAISGLMANEWVAGLLAVIVAMGTTAAVVYKLATALAFLSTYWAGSVASSILAGVTALYQYIAAAYAAVGANAALAASLAAATMGLSLVVGGIAAVYAGSKFAGNGPASSGKNVPATGFGRPSASGMGGGTEINIYGDVGDKEYQRLKDEFPDMYSEERTIEQETEK